MDLLTIHLPIADVEFNIVLFLAIGFCVGTLSGFFGVGGGWIITPALNIFGFSMPFAIGTDLALITGQSIVATFKHRKYGNVDWRLGLLSMLGSIAGVETGKQLIMILERSGSVDSVVRWIYMTLLFALGTFIVYDYFSTARILKRSGTAGSSVTAEAPRHSMSRLRNISLPPYVSLPASGIERISLWLLVGIFFASGILSGFMGVGGGFILLPSLIYLIGCPTTVAIGTSLLSVCFMAGYGSFSYSLSGRTEPIAALIMLAAASVGAQLGAMATRYVRGLGIRLLFGCMLLLAGLSVLLKQAHALADIPVMGGLAAYAVMGGAGGMTVLIIVRFAHGVLKDKRRPV